MRSIEDALVAMIQSLTPSDIPDVVRARSVDAVVDCIGVAVAGSTTPAAENVLAAARCLDGDEYAGSGGQIIGSKERLPPSWAALYNGCAAHALDFDDTLLVARSHVTGHLLPVMLDLAVRTRASGRQLIAAYAVGAEVEAVVGAALGIRLTVPRQHPTGALGSLGAAATAASLLGLDGAAARHALGIAASLASGLWCNVGTMTKPLHAGIAARNGLTAAVLAAEGVTSGHEALEGVGRFLDVFGGAPPKHDIATPLDGVWRIPSPFGLALKPYPSCSLTHSAIDAVLTIRPRPDPADVVSVEVGTNRMAAQFLVHEWPATPLEAKFSMPFCVACALVDGAVNNASFTDSKIHDETVRSVMGRIVTTVAKRLEHDPNDPAEVVVTTRSGDSASCLVECASGMPARWLSRERLREKFLSNTSIGATDIADRLFDRASAMWDASDLDGLIDDLSNSCASAGGQG